MHPSPLEKSPAMPAPVVTTGRDLRLDLFRGIALWLIFLDHIPSNVVAWGTIRNYGFSDATEIFVFVSGYTAAFVYGKEMGERGFMIAGAHILRRVWQIYVAHVFLFAIYLAEISYVATSFENPLYAEEMNILDFLKQPEVTIVQALLLKFKPANMDILPLYIVLLLLFPPILWLLQLRASLALGASVLKSRWLWTPIVCGQHSLEIFCLGVFLSFAAHFAMVEISGAIWMQLLLSAVGILVMIAVAGLLSWYKRAEGRSPGSRPRKT